MSGGKGGGGSQQVTQTTTAQPWKPAIPYAKDIMGQAQNLFNNYQPGYYPGSGVAPLSPETQSAIQAMWDRATAGNPLTSQGQNALSGVLASGGGVPQSAFDFLGGSSGLGFTNPGMAGTADALSLARGKNPAYDLIMSGAKGDFLNSNPFLDKMFGQASTNVTDVFKNATMPGVDTSFANAGRIGSNAMAGAYGDQAKQLGTTLDNLATNIYGGNYATERGNMLTSQNALAGLGNAQIQNLLGAAGQLGTQGVQGAQVGQGAAGLLGNLGLSNTGQMITASTAAPGLANADYTDLEKMLGVGQGLDTTNQANLNDLMARWNYYQQLPYQSLANYNNIIGPYMGAGKTSTETGPGQGGSAIGGALGGALGGASMGYSALGPWGALGGGILGGLSGLFS